jgi:hypothetical protein
MGDILTWDEDYARAKLAKVAEDERADKRAELLGSLEEWSFDCGFASARDRKPTSEDEGRLNARASVDAEFKRLDDRIEVLEEALRSIAANTCCDSCREAAIVASKALEDGK